MGTHHTIWEPLHWAIHHERISFFNFSPNIPYESHVESRLAGVRLSSVPPGFYHGKVGTIRGHLHLWTEDEAENYV